MQTERLSHCGTKAELRARARARVGRPQTSEAPHVKLFAGRPGRLFCFGSLVVLNVVRSYVLLFLLDIKIENK